MRKFVNTVLAAALGVSMIAGVSAQDSVTGDASINVQEDSQGTFTAFITEAPDFGTVDYSVTDTEVNSTLATGAEGSLIIVVTYERGDAEGWGVNISGENFTDGEVNDPLVFGVGFLQLGDANVVAAPGTAGTVNGESGYTMTDTLSNLITGAEDVGSNGIFEITYTDNILTIPAGQPVDEYVSTLTVSTTAAPDN